MYKFFSVVVVILFSLPVFAEQAQYSEGFLAVKKMFADIERKALAEEFKGISTSDGIQDGLFQIKPTNLDTSPIVAAAQAYLDSLSMSEKIRSHFAIDDPEWRKWFNVDNGIYVRQGLSLKEMSSIQKEAAFSVLDTSLSRQGLALIKQIMKTDKTLSEINGNAPHLDEELYFLTIMGIPSKTMPWGWQLDGHHLVINYFVLGDQVVMTPTFLGTEPAIAKTGKYKGNTLLQDEQSAGLALIQSLSQQQQKKAIIEALKIKDNMLAAAHQDNLILDYQGIPARELNALQRQALLELIAIYINNMKEGHAKIRMSEIEAHFDNTWFTWIGSTQDDSVFYYRIHSPVVLIEFDHQNPVGTESINPPGKPTRDHIHIVIRTPNGNDYGKDLLKQHLAKHKH